jgi:hypothetical protein
MKDIIIVGNGKTSRANVEALIDDYFYAYPELTVYVAVYDGPSEGQVWAVQYAEEKGKSIVALASDNAKTFGVPNKYLDETRYSSPLRSILELAPEADLFMLWDDEDTVCLDALAMATEFGVTALDLTNGLFEIKPAANLTESVKPEIPKQEIIKAEEEESEEEEPEDEEEWEEVEAESDDPVRDAINALAAVIANEIAESIVEQLKKGSSK